MDSLFGGGVAGKTREVSGPGEDSSDIRMQLLRQMLSGGIPSTMQGYLDKVLVPSTTNALTAAGIGRSGAVGEAVANATLGQGMQFIEALLSGVPSSQVRETEKKPGAVDWLSVLGPIVGALWGRGGIWGGSEK